MADATCPSGEEGRATDKTAHLARQAAPSRGVFGHGSPERDRADGPKSAPDPHEAPAHHIAPDSDHATETALYRRFTRLAVALTAVMAVLYIVWNVATGNAVVEQTVLVEARAMSEQMQATWDYIDQVQDVINYDADGSYNFRGVYCATAAKQVASEVTQGTTGYTVRYVRRNPRNVEDAPDGFETEALAAFKDGDGREYYAIADYDGVESFRYLSRLDITENCLECHGKPAGSRDPTGGYREGRSAGDLAGAASIVIPLDGYRAQAQARTAATLAFFGALLVSFVVCIRAALKRWVVAPMRRTNRALEKANAAKSDFLTLMSHELRTPLSSIIAFTGIWEKSGAQRDDDERHLVAEIKDNSEVLLGMVNNLIDAAKVDAGRYDLAVEEVDALDVLDVAKSTVEPLAIEKGVSLRVGYDGEVPPVAADWEALRKILTNLMGNAVKFTGAGGSVDVHTWYDAEADAVSVAVADTGRGIEPQDLDRVFERFERTQTEAPGSGLGLTLARDLARMMGGDVDVRSEPGVGSTFTVRLPRFDEQAQVSGDGQR